MCFALNGPTIIIVALVDRFLESVAFHYFRGMQRLLIFDHDMAVMGAIVMMSAEMFHHLKPAISLTFPRPSRFLVVVS